MAKPGLMVAIGLKPKAKTDSSGSMKAAKPVDSSEDFDASAEAAFQAVKDDDLEGFKLAFKAAVMACQSNEYSEDE